MKESKWYDNTNITLNCYIQQAYKQLCSLETSHYLTRKWINYLNAS